MNSRILVLLAAALLATPVLSAQAATTPAERVEGQLPSGAAYLMDMPANWNGTVMLFSHGYSPVGAPNPAQDAPSPDVRQRLLDAGYALIGSSYATNGWAVTDAVPDQLATLDLFTERFGEARRTIAWGQSYGGFVTTALAERHADRFDGSLSICGLVQGGVANWNSTLDPVFALRTLLAPDSDIRLTGFADQAAARSAAGVLSAKVTEAQQTPEGRARIALAAALHNIPGHNDPSQPVPGPTDWDTQQANQYAAVTGLILYPAFSWRQEAETRAGGNPSWNTGVDYTRMLHRSSVYKEVTELYKEAGLSLRKDLKALNSAPRISADAKATAWMSRTSAFTGRLADPQLNIHTTGDALIPVQAESAYRRAATAGGSGALLRQAYVDGPGHCTFTTGETVAAVRTLEHRLDTGRWDTSAAVLNSRAEQEDPATEARYVTYRPTEYPRPYDVARTHTSTPPGAARP
ncbi:prolyl oligopeptidase family serine peptidase [Streptomyces sp. ADMS]|uniref:alpha/beta hydrolase family protein n=1 Tax=Streptomyces sp. ADMS TaxID=3071415 RepID=UPI00296F1C2F|nr:prolyl oligopeptidase family serine peptidase [Streptomyces sp. ADMS]MDW4908915.1 prolyl oligopeptidase family serine peptidase [Streptomyces sp. ADMS]